MRKENTKIRNVSIWENTKIETFQFEKIHFLKYSIGENTKLETTKTQNMQHFKLQKYKNWKL